MKNNNQSKLYKMKKDRILI